MRGLVAFFDILGYQNFLEQNDSLSATTERVLEIINEIPIRAEKTVSDLAIRKFANLPEVPIKDVAKYFDSIIFSDTVVLTLRYPENANGTWVRTALNYFIAVSLELFEEMFKEGLPMRGVITEGNFLIRKNCFAGRPFIDAYKLSQLLGFSGVVFHPKLTKRLQNIYRGWPVDLFFVYCQSPIKAKQGKNKKNNSAKLMHLSWLDSFTNRNKFAPLNDVDAFVVNSFSAHNKTLSSQAKLKADHTVEIIKVIPKILRNNRDKRNAGIK